MKGPVVLRLVTVIYTKCKSCGDRTAPLQAAVPCDIDGNRVTPDQINALVAERDRSDAQLKTIWDECRKVTGHPEMSSKSPVSVMFEMFGSLMEIARAAEQCKDDDPCIMCDITNRCSHRGKYELAYEPCHTKIVHMALMSQLTAHEAKFGPIGGE